MKIIKNIKDSIYNPSFYNEQKESPTGSGFKYLIEIVLLFSLVLTILVSFRLIPTVRLLTSEKTLNEAINTFPEELTLTLKGGILSTNVTEPYSVPLKKTDNQDLNVYKNSPAIENLITIDTKSPFTLENFEKSKSLIFLSKEFLVSRKSSNGQITAQPLKSIPDIEVSRNKISAWIAYFQPFFKFIIPVLLLLNFVILFVGYTLNSITTILFMSVIIICVEKIRKTQITFTQIFRLGYYAITPLLIVRAILGVFEISLSGYLVIAIFMATFYYNVKDKREVDVSSVPSI